MASRESGVDGPVGSGAILGGDCCVTGSHGIVPKERRQRTLQSVTCRLESATEARPRHISGAPSTRASPPPTMIVELVTLLTYGR
jgi:hypothetical protein